MNKRIASDTNIAQSIQRLCRWVFVCLTGILLTACGFQMQGEKPLPFDSIYITIPKNTQFGVDIRRAIRAVSPNTKIVEANDIELKVTDFGPDDDVNVKGTVQALKLKKAMKLAQAKLEQIADNRQTRQVSLNAQGKVEELELSIRYTYRLVTAKDQIIIPETTITAVRNMPFDDRVVQAKEGEAATIFKDMQRSLVTRIIRRLTAPDVKTRWDAVAAEPNEDDDPVEIAKPVRTPGFIPTPWQNPSLTPAPIPINPD